MKVVFFLLVVVSVAFSQINRAILTGVVTDPSGAAIVNAKITAVQKATNTSATTSSTDTGNYTLPALDIGVYRVEAEAPGFKRVVRDPTHSKPASSTQETSGGAADSTGPTAVLISMSRRPLYREIPRAIPAMDSPHSCWDRPFNGVWRRPALSSRPGSTMAAFSRMTGA
jgi:hypothetical protein